MFKPSLILALVLFATIGASPAQAQGPGPEEGHKFVQLMSDYLQLADQVVGIAGRKDAAVFLALEGIFEIYEQRHDAPGAIRHYERLLDEYGKDPTVRNLIRMKLREIYKKTGQADKALEQLDLIIHENAG